MKYLICLSIVLSIGCSSVQRTPATKNTKAKARPDLIADGEGAEDLLNQLNGSVFKYLSAGVGSKQFDSNRQDCIVTTKAHSGKEVSTLTCNDVKIASGQSASDLIEILEGSLFEYDGSGMGKTHFIAHEYLCNFSGAGDTAKLRCKQK